MQRCLNGHLHAALALHESGSVNYTEALEIAVLKLCEQVSVLQDVKLRINETKINEN